MRKPIKAIRFLPLFILLPILLACNLPQWSQDTSISATNKEDTTRRPYPTNLTTSVDRQLLRQIKGLGDIFAENKIWKGYDYRTYPQYLVHVTKEGPDRAFLINPPFLPPGALLLGKNENQGLEKVYRYDGMMQDAYKDLFGANGNEVFTFDFQIGIQAYYTQAYTDDLSAGMNDPSMTVSYSTHELFHRFQDEWEWVPDSKQDFDNFPITAELLELQILCQEVLKDLPDSRLDQQQIRALLQQYVAIRSREMQLDPTPDQLIKNHELYQEQMEGSARYIEVMSNQQFFSAQDYEARFGYSLLEFWVESKEDVRGLVGQSVYYGTGGSTIYLLHRLGIPIEEMQLGKTPYQLASDYLQMSADDLESALQKAYSHPKMEEIRDKVKAWIALK
jgi:hypothetical protein